MTANRPFGFGDVHQTAAFFGLPEEEVIRRADSGEWPVYRVAGKRVFSLDQLIENLVTRPAGQEGDSDA